MSEVGFCRQLCASEPLAGTGPDAVVRWVLLEDGGPWGPATPRDTNLPEAVIEWLLARDAEPGTRVQLIRRPGSSTGSRRRLILAAAPTAAADRKLIELDVELEALPDLELDPILASAPPCPTLAALWLVCTHGTRDRCCAKWGMPVFEALRQRVGDRVWQTSHLSGHRFAPTFLALPGGLLWGRFDVARIDGLCDALALEQLAELGSLRGRCCHPRAVQAAESLIREREEIVEDDALVLVEAAPTADGRTVVRFARRPGEAEIEVAIETVRLDNAAPISCGEPPERRSALALL
ncbi:MAG TPA: sucrase ferredoxin [Enhygromyxa sp.]|nr:sucrase ferredoxin [Enhygromyxa sp.]